MRVGLLRVRPDRDGAEERAMRAAFGHALEQLARGAARRGVIREGDVGRFLRCAQQEGAVEMALRPLAFEPRLAVVTRQLGAESERETLVTRVAAELDPVLRQVDGGSAFVLQF